MIPPVPNIPPAELEEYRVLRATVLDGEELKRRRKDGLLVDVSFSVTAIGDAGVGSKALLVRTWTLPE